MPRASRKKHPVNTKPAPQKPAVPLRSSPSKTSPSQLLTVSHAPSVVSVSSDACGQTFPRLPAVSSSESLTPSTVPDALATVKSSLLKRLESDTQERARKTSTGSSIAPRKLQKQSNRDRERRPSSVSGYSASILSISEYTPRSMRGSETDTVADAVSPVSPPTSSDIDVKHGEEGLESSQITLQDSVTNDLDTVPACRIEAKELGTLPTLSLPFVPFSMSPPSIAKCALKLYPCAPKNIPAGDDRAATNPTIKEIVGHLTRWPLHTTLAVASQLPVVGPHLPTSPLVPKPGEKAGLISTTELAIKTGIGLVVAGGWSAAGIFLPTSALTQ